MLFEATGGIIFEQEMFVFGGFTIGCPLLPLLPSPMMTKKFVYGFDIWLKSGIAGDILLNL